MTQVIQTNVLKSAATVSTFPITFGQTVTAGNTLIATVGTISGSIAFTMSDNVNGSWPAAIVSSGGHQTAIFCLPGTSNLGGTITVTVASSPASNLVISIYEASGLTGVADKTGNNGTGGGSTSSSMGPTGTLGLAGELIVTAVTLGTTSSSWAAGGGYNLLVPAQPTLGASSWFIVTDQSSQTATMTWGTTTGYSGQYVTFYPPANLNLGSTAAAFQEGNISITGQDVATTQAGGTGRQRDRRKAKIVLSRDIYRDEMARLERLAREATEQREQIEKLSPGSPYEPDPQELEKYIADFERALARAQAREQRSIEVPVLFRVPKKSTGVMRVEHSQRLEALARVARHREQVALERLRKVRDRIDEEAAGDFMRWLMAED